MPSYARIPVSPLERLLTEEEVYSSGQKHLINVCQNHSSSLNTIFVSGIGQEKTSWTLCLGTVFTRSVSRTELLTFNIYQVARGLM